MRWTVLEPGALCNFYNWLGKAQNWSEFRETMKGIWGPGRTWCMRTWTETSATFWGACADSKEGTRRSAGAGRYRRLRMDRDTFRSSNCRKCSIPESGLIVTANARVIGPNYKPYLTDHWEEPYRTARIYDLLQRQTRSAAGRHAENRDRHVQLSSRVYRGTIGGRRKSGTAERSAGAEADSSRRRTGMGWRMPTRRW